MSPKKKARLNHANNPLNSTDSVLASFEQVSQSTSSPVSKLTSQPASQNESIHSDQSTSLPVGKSVPLSHQPSSLKKATFKIDQKILDSLDRYHLQLQIDLGKRNAPFKETIVELALQNILHEAQNNPELLLQRIQEQQQLRS